MPVFLEPTLSLVPSPALTLPQAYSQPVNGLPSAGYRNQLFSLMDQSAVQELKCSGAWDSQRGSELGDTGGLLERPSTGCASLATIAAPTKSGHDL